MKPVYTRKTWPPWSPPGAALFSAPELKGCNWSLCSSLQPWTFISLWSSLKTLHFKSHHQTVSPTTPSSSTEPRTPPSLLHNFHSWLAAILTSSTSFLIIEDFTAYIRDPSNTPGFSVPLAPHHLGLASHACLLAHVITKYCMLPLSQLYTRHSLITLFCLALELTPSRVQKSAPSEPTIH